MQTQQPPSGHQRADRIFLFPSHCGQFSESWYNSSRRPGQFSRKHRVLPRYTWCLHLCSTSILLHMIAEDAGDLCGTQELAKDKNRV